MIERYEDDSMINMVKDNIDSVSDLKAEYDRYLDQSFKKRRNADDMSLMISGETNPERFERQMNELLKENAEEEEPNKLKDEDRIENAKQWCIDSNIQMVYPTDELDKQYQLYLDQEKDSRRRADWKCMELFGMNNIDLYNELKKAEENDDKEYAQDIDNYNLTRLYTGSVTSDTNSVSTSDEPITETVMRKRRDRKILERIHENLNRTYKWEFIYAPYFSPKEIFELEGCYSDDVEDKANEIFVEYVNYYNGYNNNFNIIEWKEYLSELSMKLEYCDNIEDKNRYKQSMLKLGWNPEIQLNTTNMSKAKNRLENIINESYKNVLFLDLTSLSTDNTGFDVVQEAQKRNIKAIHVVLVRGDSFFSDIIASYTHGEFSHSAICLDNDFDRLYSFNAMHESNPAGGMSLESIKDYPKENRLAVFTFFVSEEDYVRISDLVQDMLTNIKNTSYSYLNALTMPFKNINLNRDESLICSQFVDKLLKLARIDITKIDSSKVTPSYLYDVSIKNSKVYKIFDDVVKKFDFKKATSMVNRLSRKAKPVVENVIDKIQAQYEYATISEARKLPIEFNNDGDVLLTNPFVDFDAEYFNSHKLLKQYEKTNNINGMKYELARLYYMNYVLEKRIYNSKFSNKKESYTKTRARVLNDFNKYLAIVLSKEKNFNFSKYYEDSPFYAHTVEVKGSTLKGMTNLIKSIF